MRGDAAMCPLRARRLENIEVVRHDRTLTFELKSADSSKEMKSVHMAKDKGSKGARFESGHHKSFVFRATGFDALDDWVAALQQHAVAIERPSTQVPRSDEA